MPESQAAKPPVTVLHLRSASGGGGGPDKTIFTEAALADPGRVRLVCVYMRKPGEELDGVKQRAEASGAIFLELPGGALFDMWQFGVLNRIIKQYGVSILHCHEPKGDVYGALLGLLGPKVKVITTLHGWTAHRSIKSALYARLDRMSLHRFDLVVAVSKPLEEAARNAGASHVVYIPNGVDTDRWRRDAARDHPAVARLDASRRWVGYVGRLSKEKAPEVFLQMAGQVSQRASDAGFVIAGEGDAREMCQQLAVDLGIADRTVFLGSVSEAAVSSLVSRLAVLVNSSRTEGLPNNVLEAMAMGVPVVATAVGGVPDLVKEGVTGFLHPPDDPDALAGGVCALLEAPERAAAMGEAGRERVVRKFSFRKRVEKMTTVYESLAGMS